MTTTLTDGVLVVALARVTGSGSALVRMSPVRWAHLIDTDHPDDPGVTLDLGTHAWWTRLDYEDVGTVFRRMDEVGLVEHSGPVGRPA